MCPASLARDECFTPLMACARTRPPQTLEDAADATGDALGSLELGVEGNALGGEMLAQGRALMGSLLARAKDASPSDQARCARIREVAVAVVLCLRGALSLVQAKHAAPLLEAMTAEVVLESDKRVKALLGCKDKGPSEDELAHAWEAQQAVISCRTHLNLEAHGRCPGYGPDGSHPGVTPHLTDQSDHPRRSAMPPGPTAPRG
eukprot:489931-Prymnesium_polylepis.1